MNKKLFLLLLATMQAESIIEARGGGGRGGGGGGHRGGGSRGGGGRSGGASHSRGHSRGHAHRNHGGYGHGGYGWGGFGVGIASGMLIGLAVSAPSYYNSPSTEAQQETVGQIKSLQKDVYDLQQKINTADNMNDIKKYQTEIKQKSNQAQKLIDATPE